jgi:glucosamine 6-phosphate synthetase-like amidotransferase/phosphosugar isomerase protein
MKDYGLQRSAVEPLALEITDSKVFVASDIEQVTVTVDEQEVQEWQFNLVEYNKDEYIKIISNRNKEIEQNILDTQVALCDVYEMLT